MPRGIAASEGIGIGNAFCIRSSERKTIYRKPEDPEKEVLRFRETMDTFYEETKKSAERLQQRGLTKESGILSSHIEMAKDPFMISKIQEEIRGGCCAEEAVDKTLDFFAEMFAATGDELTMQRASDVRDIKRRITNILTGDAEQDLSELPSGTILVLRELTPSMTISLNTGNISGIITETGGYTSHSAILSRALEIPAVLSLHGALETIKTGDRVIIDGISGEVKINPDMKEVQFYQKKYAKFMQEREALKIFRGVPGKMASGEPKEVFANIGKPQDAAAAKNDDAEGIGLFRTEFLYMDRGSAPSEEEQFMAYRKAAEVFAPAPVIIRTLDIGGDKEIPYLQMEKEDNPFLGFRAIRYCLDNTKLFKTQLRALLRANAFGNIRIMLPMITNLQEIRAVKDLLELCCRELREEKKTFDGDVQLGIMIETPAAAATADLLAKESDFFSIGTNDLIAYMMSADRGNDRVAGLYTPYQPAVLRSIKQVCEAAHKEGIPVGMCGEAASDPLLIPCLLAFGLDEFSVSREKVLKTRKEISRWEKQEASEISQKVMSLASADEVEHYLREKQK